MDKVVHFEIPFDDADKAGEFYKSVFGWKVNAVPGMPYWMVGTVETDEKMMPTEAGAINGGMYKRADGGSKHPVIVINVDDIEASCKKIEEAGGEVTLEIKQVGDMGKYAQFKDTQGNILGVWQPLKH